MRRGQAIFSLAALFIISAGLSYFLNLCFQASRFTILSHSFRFLAFPFMGILLGSFLLLAALWRYGSAAEAKRFGLSLASRLKANLSTLSPLCLFLLTPLLPRHYLTREDLKARLHLLLFFILAAVIFLKVSDLYRIHKQKTSPAKKEGTWFGALSPKKRVVLLFLIAFLFYNLCTLVLVLQGITFSGDEPNYLLSAHSLLRDGDINLANNYAQRDYFHFYSEKDNPRLRMGIYGRYGKKGKDEIYPINLPGISVLMLPFYWLSQFFKGPLLTFILKGSLSLWAALLGVQLYLLIRDIWHRERLALGLWFLYSFTTPVLFYAIHLYPEVPLTLFLIYIYRKVTSSQPLSPFQYLLIGFLLSTFFWFGVKFNFIFWPLLLVSVYFLLKYQKAGLKILLFLFFPLLSTALYYVFIHSLYGTFSPFSIYEGVMTEEKMQAFKEAVLGLPLTARIDAFLDYFLDQRDGLLLYAPFYFFSFIGLIEMFRRAKRDFFLLLFISLPFILNYAFFSHRQGYSPQGRVLTPLTWIGVLAIGYFLVHNHNKFFSFFFCLSSLAGIVLAAILLFNPSFLYQPTTHDFTDRPGDLFVFLSSLHFFLPPFLPSFIKIPNLNYLPNYAWILGIAIFVGLYIVWNKKREPGHLFCLSLAAIALLLSFWLWVLHPRSVLYPSQVIRYSPQKALAFYRFPMGKGVVAKQQGDFYLHFEKSYKFLFTSRTQLPKIKLLFGSEKGEHEVRIRFFDLPLFSGKTAYEKRELSLSPPSYYSYRHLFLYEINIAFKKLSAENLLLDPFFFQIIPEKGQELK
jgi:hypothetical protein